MCKRPWTRAVPVLLLAAALAAPAAADLSVFVGQVGFDDEANLETSPAFGVRWGKSSGLIGGETSLMIARPERDLQTPGVAVERATAIFYEGRVLINIPAGLVKPFVGVGFGAITTTSTPADLPTDREDAVKDALGAATDLQNNPALSYGGGVRYALSDRLGVRVDIRQYLVFSVAGVAKGAIEDALGEDLADNETVEDLSDNKTVQYNELSVGVVFNF